MNPKDKLGKWTCCGQKRKFYYNKKTNQSAPTYCKKYTHITAKWPDNKAKLLMFKN